MPPFGPIKRRDLVRTLRAMGFDGPFPRGKHALMQRADVTLIVPNPHRGDIGRDLLARLLREAGISRQEWESMDT